MLRNVLICAAVLLLAAGLTAQTQVPVHKATTPQFAGVYTLDGGLQKSPVASRSGPAVLFNNMILSGYYSVPGAGQEWIDEGGLLDRNSTNLAETGTYPVDQINGFDFVYCSTEPDPTGNSGTIDITFYDETVRCAGPPTWPTANCAYSITGLPLGGPTGNIQCWIVFVDLEGGFECPPDLTSDFRTEEMGVVDRLFGWGFIPMQNNTGPWIAKGGYRRDNSFTWFDPTTGAFIGCFWFGGFPFANFAMKMYGYPVNTRVYDSPSNPGVNNVVLRIDAQPVPGNTVTFTATTPAGGGGGSYWFGASLNSADLGIGGQQLLAGPAFLPPTPLPMSGGILTVTLPAMPPEVYCIAAETTGPPSPGAMTGLSNGLKLAQ